LRDRSQRTIAVRHMQLKALIYYPLLCALLFTSGCGKKASNVERGLKQQELYVGIQSSPSGLDPHLTTGVVEQYILIALLEGLVTRDGQTLEVKPGVAKSWDMSADGKTYTFHLDPNARWSNGDPLVADDFVFSFKRILSPALGAPNAYMLYPMRGAEAYNKGELVDFSKVGVSAPSPKILVIELDAPTPYFLGLLSHVSWFPVHPPTILKHGTITDRASKWTQPANFVGNGPFNLESWKLNAPLSVMKNPLFRDPDSIRLKRIHFLPIPIDPEERAFRAGHLHLTYFVPSHRIDWYLKNQPERIRFDTYLGTYYYGLNVNRPPLDDVRVRKALAYSINREDLIEHILRAGQKAAYHFTPPNTGGYNAKDGFSYDPQLARQLLADAGFPEGEGFPKLQLLYNTSEQHQTIAVAIQQMWKTELGIDIELYNQEWKVYLSTREEGNFDIMRAGWIGDYDDPFTFLGLTTSNSGNNHTGWSNPEYDALIQKSNETLDPIQRRKILQTAETLLLEEMPIIPINFYVRRLLIHPTVHGWSPNVLDRHPYSEIYLEAEPASTD